MMLVPLLLIAGHVTAVVGRTTTRPLLPRRNAAFQLRRYGRNIDVHHCTGTNGFVGFSSTGAQSSVVGGPAGTHNLHRSLVTKSRSQIHSLNLLRGGGGAWSLMENIPDGTILIASKLFSSCALLAGTAALLAPVDFANRVLKIGDVETDSFDSSLLQSVGAIAIGFAIHVYLALSVALGAGAGDAGSLSLGQVMGYALLPRILLITWSFLRSKFRPASDSDDDEGGEYQFEGTGFLKVNYSVMSWSAFSLLTGAGNPSVSAKLFSAMALIKAIALILKPAKMTKKIFGVDVSGEEMAQSRFLSSALGYSLAVHAALMLSLACGVDPNVAVGASSLASVALSFWMARVIDGSKDES